jgi:myosin heavy chain 9/10/11/14
MELLRTRLAEAMEDERKQHQQDIEERDFNIEAMRKKYQGMCFQYS